MIDIFDFKDSRGSTVISLIFVMAIICVFFIFAFETASLFIVKQKNESLAKNIASSLAINVDKDKLMKQGKLSIDKISAKRITETIISNSNVKNNIFKNVTVSESYKYIGADEIVTTVRIDSYAEKVLFFYKDVNIISEVSFRTFIDTDALKIDEMTWEEIWKLVNIEEVRG